MMWNPAAWLLSDRSDSVPRRVQAAIERQQQESEVLVGWAQLAIVVTWATLYALTPKTFDETMTFAPVPWALSAYGLFTLVRLWLARRGALPRWFLGLSVFVDMAVLMALIWSFHLQYRQPAAFYLKAPTLLYVFIFIALRALRFETRFVLLAGLAAALGWVVLVLYAIAEEGGMALLTRDYIAYMTSVAILRGAEADKIISILLVTAVLAIAIRRARALLVTATTESAAAANLGRFFAPEIAATIRGADRRLEPGQAVMRHAAILMCDLRGFTTLAMRKDPVEVMDILAQYQGLLVPIIRRHGGNIDKFLGDGILATFGATEESTSAAADALRAVEEMVGAARGWSEAAKADESTGLDSPNGQGLRVGFAVAAGPVLFGCVGDAERLEYTVIGESVNLAAKLEKATKAEGVQALTTLETFRAATEQGYVPDKDKPVRMGRRIEGLSTPIDLVVLADR